jgi:membrane associated rhomboid family serine protease
MGIEDRHYVRRETQRPGGFGRGPGPISGMRMWSANTWLIVICVAVFVVDGFMKPVPVAMGIEWLVDNPRAIDDSVVKRGPVQRAADGTGLRPLIMQGAAGPVVVGREFVQYMFPIESALHFSTQRGFLEVQFWRLVGFQFLHSHGGLSHILFSSARSCTWRSTSAG